MLFQHLLLELVAVGQKGLFVPLLHNDVRITTFFWLIEFLQLIYWTDHTKSLNMNQ